MKHFVVRLNDEETYTNAENCQILVFDEEPTDEMVKNPGIENLCAEIQSDDDHTGGGGIVIKTWKDTERIKLSKEWDR